MIIKKLKRKLKKIKVAIFISDVGFGHMVRQREVIHQLIDKIKNVEITLVNGLQIEILKETLDDKVKYIKRFNNIELLKTKDGYFGREKSIKTLDVWNKNLRSDFTFFKKNFKNFNFIISDLVPQVFYYAKKLNIKCYGVCHFSWSWYFETVYPNKKKLIVNKIKKYENMATKIFLPPLTPKGVYLNIDNVNKIKNINFISQPYKSENTINRKKTFLIMDNGTQTLSELISETVPYLKKMKNYIFYIGISSLNNSATEMILKSNNMIPVTTLKGMYSYIGKVDHVIVRGGFNSITECLFFKKPAIFMNEKFNPEIDENLKIIFDKNLGAIMNKEDWKLNFSKRIDMFIKNEVNLIKKNLNRQHFQYNGASQLIKTILKDVKL